MQKFRENSGFTLVEMITTMTILSILSVFSIKPMGKFVGQARQSEAKMTLGHISSTQSTYAIAHSQYASITHTDGYGGGQGTCEALPSKTCTATGQAACEGDKANCKWNSTNQCNGQDWLKVSGCMQMRYKYVIKGDTKGYYAYATTNGNDLVFGCDVVDTGANREQIVQYDNSNPGVGSRYGNQTVTTHPQDGHFVTEEQGLTVSYDAVQNCE